jgi:hypothetical protein
MQTYIDTATQKIWSFDDDVVVSDTLGSGYTFIAPHGAVLAVPTTLQPYAVPAPTPAQLAAVAWSTYQNQALQALMRSDNTMARVQEAIILGHNTPTGADVVAYVTWRRQLRMIVSAANGDPTQPLPVEPTYPTGT